MLGIVISREDTASMRIGHLLLECWNWHSENDIQITKDRLLFFIDDLHIYHDNIDREIVTRGHVVDAIVIASRHTSQVRTKTLSIHPVGNYREVHYGGKSEQLVRCPPLLMHNALTLLHDQEIEGYKVCYEVTHHGPFLETPCFFIETGGTEREWNDERACLAIAETIMQVEKQPRKMEIAVGIGGGHYAPRFTDMALKQDIAFGHMAARYVVDNLSVTTFQRMIDATPDCTKVYFHGEHPKIASFARAYNLNI